MVEIILVRHGETAWNTEEIFRGRADVPLSDYGLEQATNLSREEAAQFIALYFEKYPKNWGLKSTDKNIDHRRVPNLMKFFERHGEVLNITNNPKDYSPGDIVCWNLGGGITHIGIVINRKSSNKNEYLIVHNIGSGQVIEDILFDYKIIGHYRYEK